MGCFNVARQRGAVIVEIIGGVLKAAAGIPGTAENDDDRHSNPNVWRSEENSMLVIKFETEEGMNAMRAHLEALDDPCPLWFRSTVLDKDKLELGVNILHIDEATAIAEGFGGEALYYLVP